MNHAPPQVDPKTITPKPSESAKPPFDPNNPLGEPQKSPEQAAKSKAVEAATNMWEKNVGPIDESPAVKRALIELVSDPEAMDALTDSKGNNIFELFSKEGADGEKFGDLFGGDGGSNFEWPKLDFGLGRDHNFDLGGSHSSDRFKPNSSSSSSSPRLGNSGSGMGGSFSVGEMQVPWVLALLLLALVGGFIVWWKWTAIFTTANRDRRASDRRVGTRGPSTHAKSTPAKMWCEKRSST